jgi:predicted Zn-dependent protease
VNTRLIALVALIVAAPSVTSPQDVVERALADEMSRSLEELRLGDEPRPYFLSYRLDDLEVTEIGASFGSPIRHSLDRSRVLSAELRVGTAQHDNTNFFSFGGRGSGITRAWNGSLDVPVEDDYRELRRQAWLLTDATYKTALENLARKTAVLNSRRTPGDLPDFTPVSAATVEEILEAPRVDPLQAEALVSSISRVFRRQPAVDHSVARLREVRQHSRYFNSEGSSFVRSVPLVELSFMAVTQAADGTRLTDVAAHYGHAIDDLPKLEELLDEAAALGAGLAASRGGSQIERYNGPVLFTGQAAAEVFHQVFAPGLAAWRPPIAEDERLERRLIEMGASLNDRLGGRVLARSMRLIDDPRADTEGDRRLYGGYEVDDEGVPGAPTVLAERGILKALVASRNPASGVTETTGNRRGAIALPSNLLLSTSEGRSEDELLGEMWLLVDERELEFGVVVRRIANPRLAASFESRGNGARAGLDGAVGGVVEAFKVFRDGRRELLRDPRFSGFTAANFRDIVAASEARTVYSAPLLPEHAGVALLSSGTLGSTLAGPAVVSVVVPDLLFEELTIALSTEAVPRTPVISHPYFAE